MKVEQIMSVDVKFCTENDRLNRAAQLMWENDCGFVPVLAFNGEPKLAGVLTDRDICMAAYTQGMPLSEIAVSVAMAQKVHTCNAGDDVRQAEALIKQNQVRRLVVVDDKGMMVGVVSINDLAIEAEHEIAAKTKSPELREAEVADTLASICQHRKPRLLEPAL